MIYQFSFILLASLLIPHPPPPWIALYVCLRPIIFLFRDLLYGPANVASALQYPKSRLSCSLSCPSSSSSFFLPTFISLHSFLLYFFSFHIPSTSTRPSFDIYLSLPCVILSSFLFLSFFFMMFLTPAFLSSCWCTFFPNVSFLLFFLSRFRFFSLSPLLPDTR